MSRKRLATTRVRPNCHLTLTRTGSGNLCLTRAAFALADSPPVYASDVAFACEQEMALTLGDVMCRRTQLALSRNGGAETATHVARLMAPLLQWEAGEERAQVGQYLTERKQGVP